mmetsp:Transcript_53/g.97  ORF Transcript_53/g.97 Transcript_53/m.97 type:complete len:534 (-) Transcript_53:398-1999(-)|eukprot:CAMPEP_0178993904 /NCGR_PEP_ID=MMETSP0795-20121207/6971_1 /TAXON_ID=88552 /ORGANISM="Amoebophrya sp., Strain Ameob2" /LENGTH=533 /DNA_ID=CAMNT_0020686033 /DNA_START=58 /DNA_END=1659 /DNA_ORIENTATION=-
MAAAAPPPAAEAACAATEHLFRTEADANDALISGDTETAIQHFQTLLTLCDKQQRESSSRVSFAPDVDAGDDGVTGALAASPAQAGASSARRSVRELRAQALTSLANCFLQSGQWYSAYKHANLAVRAVTQLGGNKMSKKGSSDPLAELNSTEARLARARAVTFMERRDEMYYDDEDEHAKLLAEAMTDLHAVLHAEPTNQPAKNEVAFLNALREKKKGGAGRGPSGEVNNDGGGPLGNYTSATRDRKRGYQPAGATTRTGRRLARSNSDGGLGALRNFNNVIERNGKNDPGVASDSDDGDQGPATSGRAAAQGPGPSGTGRLRGGTAGFGAGASPGPKRPTATRSGPAGRGIGTSGVSEYQKAVQLAAQHQAFQTAGIPVANANVGAASGAGTQSRPTSSFAKPSYGGGSGGNTGSSVSGATRAGRGTAAAGAATNSKTAGPKQHEDPALIFSSSLRSGNSSSTRGGGAKRGPSGSSVPDQGEQGEGGITEYVRKKSSLLQRPQSASETRMGKSRSEAVIGQLALHHRRPFC